MRAAGAHPIGTPTKGVSPNTGPLATAAWLVARGIAPPGPRWDAVILLSTSHAPADDDASTLFRIELFSEEWGFSFRHEGRVSWIRVTDVPFVHGRDDHGLLATTRTLKNFGAVVRSVEERFGLTFAIDTAVIRTSIVGAEPAIRDWINDW